VIASAQSPTVTVWCFNRSAQEVAKAAAIAYTAVAVAVNISLVLRPGELHLVSNPPWTRVAALMAVFNFFDGVRQLLSPASANLCLSQHHGAVGKGNQR